MNAIVTGATKGMGRAIAIKLAESGYNLAICARNNDELISLKEELELKGVDVTIYKADMGKKDEVYGFCEHVASTIGTIDVLVNNAGTFLTGEVLDETDEQFATLLNLNLNASYYCTKFFGKIMRKQRFGHVFNVCSTASKVIAENAGSYSVTKTALLSLNNVFREELSKYNVKVTAVLPGSTLTSSWDGTDIPSERFVQPEDVANSIYNVLQLSNGANVDEITITPVQF
ncbi:MAG: SDR family oxidoreductase [Pedobacter sp.]|nr:MAG: SDR family oxidoreductase [Pedobacter sp.]